MISTHILDTSKGHPAEGVPVRLEKQDGDSWRQLGLIRTNSDGRIVFECPYEAGVYRLSFEIEDYLFRQHQEVFFLNLPVTFRIQNTQRKYHIPLLLNPYGLSTYRGS